jgi:ribosomal-protein-alanine N-acetyltransferase
MELLMKAIETKRLLLRDMVASDLREVHEYASEPDVVRFMHWGPNTEDETREFIEKSILAQKEKPRRDFDIAIILKSTGDLIGGCGIHVSNPENREGWIGYCLNRNFWGKGYATETAQALVKFGFERLDMHRIFANCDPQNLASARVLEKSGMKKEGQLREHRWSKGKWRDSSIYAILEQDDWK